MVVQQGKLTSCDMYMQITPREYLETALKSVHGEGRAVEAKNAVRSHTFLTLFGSLSL